MVTLKPYKEMYVGMLSKDRREIAFQRFNDVPSGGEIERFLATPEPMDRNGRALHHSVEETRALFFAHMSVNDCRERLLNGW